MDKINQIFENSLNHNHLTFVIHSDSFINSSQKEIQLLCWIMEYNLVEYIKLYVTPTTDPNIREIINKVPTPKYTIKYGKLIAEFSDEKSFSGSLLSINETKNRPVKKNGNLNNYDKLYFNSKDDALFVMGSTEKSVHDNELYINLKDSFDIIYIYLLKQQQFCVSPHHIVDSSQFYLYKRSKTFLGFQKIFSIAIYSNNITLTNRLQSLDSRLHFVLKSIDKIVILFYSYIGVNSQDEFIYFFSYLNMLLSGVLDDLASIFASQYTQCKKLPKTQITLRVYQDRQESKFSKNIKDSNIHLGKFIEEIDTKTVINLIYLLRDKSQHQELIKIEKHGSLDFELNITPKDIDLNFFIEKKIIYKNEDKYYLNSKRFIDLIKRDYYSIINKFLEYIESDDDWIKVPQDKKIKISNDVKIFNNELWRFYDYHYIPYLLEY